MDYPAWAREHFGEGADEKYHPYLRMLFDARNTMDADQWARAFDAVSTMSEAQWKSTFFGGEDSSAPPPPRPPMDPRYARLHVDGVGEAMVRGAFIDPRNGRWAYRIEMVTGDASKRARIIYPDQIERLEWSVRGEMELMEDGETGQMEVDRAPPPLLGGGRGRGAKESLGSRVLRHARARQAEEG